MGGLTVSNDMNQTWAAPSFAQFPPAWYREFHFVRGAEPVSLSIYWDRQPEEVEWVLRDLPVWTPLLAWTFEAQAWWNRFEMAYQATSKGEKGYTTVTALSVEELVLKARKSWGDE